MKKSEVKLGQVGKAPNPAIPAVVFSGTFDNHMQHGDQRGQSHSGLHLIGDFTKANGQILTAQDIVAGNAFAGGRLNGHAATVTIGEVDLRSKTFTADVNIYNHPKTSTFFPVGTSLANAKDYIRAAWRDYCTYGTAAYGGGVVDIYKDMKNAFGLNWVGMATIGGQEIWIGCAHAGSVDTAFPAVNNKFS